MLASPSLTQRAAMLEELVRQALAAGTLYGKTDQSIRGISQQQDLTAAEQRMLEILEDALSSGHVQRL